MPGDPGSAGAQGDRCTRAGDDIACGVVQFRSHRDRFGGEAAVVDGDGDLDDRALGVDVGRGDAGAVEADPDQLGHDERRLAVQARPGVPAGVVVGPHLHRDGVLLAVAEVIVERHGEGGVSERALSYEGVVDVDHRVAVRPLELDGDPLRPVRLRYVECLRVLVGGTREIGGLAGVGRRPLLGEEGVMRQRDLLRCRGRAAELREDARLGTHRPVTVEGMARHAGAFCVRTWWTGRGAAQSWAAGTAPARRAMRSLVIRGW